MRKTLNIMQWVTWAITVNHCRSLDHNSLTLLTNITNLYNLRQLIEEPTRIRSGPLYILGRGERGGRSKNNSCKEFD
jgi:hypothetical protein